MVVVHVMGWVWTLVGSLEGLSCESMACPKSSFCD